MTKKVFGKKQPSFLLTNFLASLDERKRNSTNFPYLKFNPIQEMGGGGQLKSSSTSFPSVTSTKVRISPQNFLTLRFNAFATLV